MLRYGLMTYHLAPTCFDVAYVQFLQGYIELPQDGAADAPKHVGAR
jgi:hypothetical protein